MLGIRVLIAVTFCLLWPPSHCEPEVLKDSAYAKGLHKLADDIQSKLSKSTAAMHRAEAEMVQAERDAERAQLQADDAMLEAQQLQLKSDQQVPKLNQEAEKEAEDAQKLMDYAQQHERQSASKRQQAEKIYKAAHKELEEAESMANKATDEHTSSVKTAEQKLASAEETDSKQLDQQADAEMAASKQLHEEAEEASKTAERKAKEAVQLQNMAVKELPSYEETADKEEAAANDLKTRAGSLLSGVNNLWRKLGGKNSATAPAVPDMEMERMNLQRQLDVANARVAAAEKRAKQAEFESSKKSKAAELDGRRLQAELHQKEEKITNLLHIIKAGNVAKDLQKHTPEPSAPVAASLHADGSVAKRAATAKPNPTFSNLEVDAKSNLKKQIRATEEATRVAVEGVIKAKADSLIREIQSHSSHGHVGSKVLKTEEEEMVEKHTQDLLKMIHKPHAGKISYRTLAKIQSAVVNSKAEEEAQLFLKNSKNSNSQLGNKLAEMVKAGAQDVSAVLTAKAVEMDSN